MIFRRFAFLFVVVAALAACNNEKTRTLIDRRADQATRMGEEAQNPTPKKSYNPLTVYDKVWAGNASVRLRHGVPLPAKYEGSRGVAVISGEPMSINEIALAVGSQTGIPVRIAPGAVANGSSSVTTAASASANSMPLTYEGPLTDLLDLVSSNFGLNWRYDGTVIELSRYETRVFTVESLPGTQTIKDGLKEDNGTSGNSTSSSTGGGSYSASSNSSLTQSSEMNVELKVWEELNQTVTSMLGGVGSVVVSPSSGTVTVTTTPELMQTVAKFIREENRRLSQQIAVNVEIYSVSLSEGSDFSLTFREALRRLTNLGVGYSSASGPTAVSTDVLGATNIATGGVDGSLTGMATGITTGAITGGGQLAVAILDPKKVGQISGLFSALSTLGDTTRVAQFPMTTLNNRTVSRRIGTDQNYVASIQTALSTTTSTPTTSTIQTATIREGYSIQLTPRLLEDGRILLQYSMSLIDNVKMDTFGTGSTQVQLPKSSSRVFVQQAMLNSGSTLIIGGYDDEQASQSSQGVGNPFNYFLGGGSSNSKTHAMLFIAITPQVLEQARPE